MFDFYNKQQVSTYATTILQLDNIHRSAVGFYRIYKRIGWGGHDQRDYQRRWNKTRTNKQEGVWQGQRGSESADAWRRGGY